MAIVRCPLSHFYDDVKYNKCPICGGTAQQEGGWLEEQKTQYLHAQEESMTLLYNEAVEEEDVTVSLINGELKNKKTSGWLVCIDGPMQGKNYTIHSGQNFAGRALDMDIVLSDDPLITREKHFSVIYDPKTIRFYLCACCGATFVNNALITQTIELHDGDILTAGKTQYVFVPYCKEGRTWDEKG